jgi:hypothetical protein
MVGLLCVALALAGVIYWVSPVPGQIAVLPETAHDEFAWPQVRFVPNSSQTNSQAEVSVTDVTPWANVELLVNGRRAHFEEWQKNPGIDSWTWRWSFTMTAHEPYTLVFYRDCDSGCVEWARVRKGEGDLATSLVKDAIPTKLGVVFANPSRNWHQRAGWDVELLYAAQPYPGYTIDDLAERVWRASEQGLHVLVRVDYDKGQALPPTEDQVALDAYLKTMRRLSRDARLRDVYGYVIGSGFNSDSSNSLGKRVTPEWYARVFNGYGANVTHSDNVIQTVHAENTGVRVLVGPVRPWVVDQDGQHPFTINEPWLNYMNTLVAALDDSTRAKASTGISGIAPDGFAVQASGRPDAPELGQEAQAQEPLRDIRRSHWNGAQAGFRVYRDWLDIINTYTSTRGLPVFITSVNTFTPDTNVAPAQNYPKGWLSNALREVNQETQVQALCWFMDELPDTQWDLFSLSKHSGRMLDAADEFDALLRLPQ